MGERAISRSYLLKQLKNFSSTILEPRFNTIEKAIEDNGTSVKVFKDVRVEKSGFVSDSTYVDYPYRVDIVCTGCTAQHTPTVNFDLTSAESNVFAPVAISATDTVTIFAKEVVESGLIIPCIVCVQ